MEDTTRSRLLATATAVLVASTGLAAHLELPPSRVVTFLALAFVPYAWLCAGASGEGSHRWVLALASGAGLVLVIAPPALSDDVFRYLWDGRVTWSGMDPYRYPPDAPALSALRDEAWGRVNHPSIATIYPPVAQALFALAAAVPGGVIPFKGLALLGHLGTTHLVYRASGSEKASLLFGLNPLALAESALAGHVDIFVGVTVLGAVVALRAERPVLASLVAGLGAGVKLVGVALIPSVLRHPRAAGLLLLLTCASVAPLLTAGYGNAAAQGVDEFARRWRGNAGGFALVSGAARGAVDLYAEFTGSRGDSVDLRWARGAIEALEGTPLDPWGGRGLKKSIRDRGLVSRAQLTASLSRGLVGALLLALAVFVARRPDPARGLRLMLLGLLLLSPQVHPWYLLWLLPLEVASRRMTVVVWSGVVLVAYAPLDGWQTHGVWEESGWGQALEYTLLLGALLLEVRPVREILSKWHVKLS